MALMFRHASQPEKLLQRLRRNSHPSADVWFGGTTDPLQCLSSKGLLERRASQRMRLTLFPTSSRVQIRTGTEFIRASLGILYDKESYSVLKRASGL